jgi:hypothetical protein
MKKIDKAYKKDLLSRKGILIRQKSSFRRQFTRPETLTCTCHIVSTLHCWKYILKIFQKYSTMISVEELEIFHMSWGCKP